MSDNKTQNLEDLKAEFQPIYDEVDEYINLEKRIADTRARLAGLMGAEPKLPRQVEDVATYFEYHAKYLAWKDEKQQVENVIVGMQKKRDDLLRIFGKLLPSETWFKHGNIGFGFIRVQSGMSSIPQFRIMAWQDKMPAAIKEDK